MPRPSSRSAAPRKLGHRRSASLIWIRRWGYDYEYQARMQSISGVEPPGAQGEYCLGSSLVNCTAPGGFGSVRPIPLPFNSRVCLLSLIWRLVFCPIKQRLASDLSQGLRRCLHSPLSTPIRSSRMNGSSFYSGNFHKLVEEPLLIISAGVSTRLTKKKKWKSKKYSWISLIKQ